jgi:hypothetical protein
MQQRLTRLNHAFATTGIYPYKTNIISDEDLEPSEIIHSDKMPDKNSEETEDGNSNGDSPLLVYGPALSTPASPQTPDNMASARKSYLH